MNGAVLRLCGDCGVTVEFENEISIETNRKVIALKYRIEGEHVPGIGELTSWNAWWRNGPAVWGRLTCQSR